MGKVWTVLLSYVYNEKEKRVISHLLLALELLTFYKKTHFQLEEQRNYFHTMYECSRPILRFYSIVYVAMETSKMSNLLVNQNLSSEYFHFPSFSF